MEPKLPLFVSRLIAVLGLFLLLSSEGHAAAAKYVKPIDSVSVTPLVGGYLFSSVQSLDPAITYGVKASYDHVGTGITDSIGVDATFNYLPTTTKEQHLKAQAYLFRLDATYPIVTRKAVTPFLALGAGGIFTDREGARDKSPLFNFGFGLKYQLEEYLAIRADVRQLMVYQHATTTSNFEITTGLTYYFGKQRRKPVPPPPRKNIPQAQEEKQAKPTAETATPAPPPPSILELLRGSGAAAMGLNLLPPNPGDAFAPAAYPAPVTAHSAARRRLPDAEPPLAPNAPPAGAAAAQPRTVSQAATPATQAPAPAPASTQPVPSPQAHAPKRSIRTLTIEFLFSSQAIRPVYQAKLAAFASLMKYNEESTAVIEGHTDNVGNDRANLALSQQRAQNVKNELVKYGVAPAKITIKGHGSQKPVSNNQSATGRHKNRRAVVTLTLIINQ
ncbi:OmpA family protein [Geomonas diazotrophica]|uniref:OmpA family protein n=1 Tax=Geomonas diazotrophica TaxID=2843197 RepID=UPI002E2E6AB6|nr:OmpA family protein [Geomonas diazotrophica]